MFCSPSHSAHRLGAEIRPEHGFGSVIWGQLEPRRVFAPFQWCMEDQEVACTLQPPQELPYSALAAKFSRKEEREPWTEKVCTSQAAKPAQPPARWHTFTEVKVHWSQVLQNPSQYMKPPTSLARVPRRPRCLFTVTSSLNRFKIQTLWPHPTGFNGFDWPQSSHLAQDEIFNKVLAELAHPPGLVYCPTGYFMLKLIMQQWRSFIWAYCDSQKFLLCVFDSTINWAFIISVSWNVRSKSL